MDRVEPPTEQEIVSAVRLGAALKKIRDPESGMIVRLEIIWPGWPGGKNPYWDARGRNPDWDAR